MPDACGACTVSRWICLIPAPQLKSHGTVGAAAGKRLHSVEAVHALADLSFFVTVDCALQAWAEELSPMLVGAFQAGRGIKVRGLAPKCTVGTGARFVSSQARHAHIRQRGVHASSAAVSKGFRVCIQAAQQTKLEFGSVGACATLGWILAVAAAAASTQGEALTLLGERRGAADPALTLKQQQGRQQRPKEERQSK